VADTLTVHVGGEPVILLADRGLYWPAMRRLIIADLHLGKGAVMRSSGIAVPAGGTGADLQRLSRLLAQTSARQLWILGDFLHGPRSSRADAGWRAFRTHHAAVGMAVVPGNHDRAFDAAAAGVEEVPEGTRQGPFVFRHVPPTGSADARAGHVLCGHLHPVLKLPEVGAHPLFWLGQQLSVLPAFSLFTGGQRVAYADAKGSVMCNGSELARIG